METGKRERLLERLPECGDFLKRAYGRLTRQDRLALISSFLIGMLTHLYMFTGKYPNSDNVLDLFSNCWQPYFGRWLLAPLCAISGNGNVPLVVGTISVAALAVQSLYTARLLDIEKPLYIVLLSAVLVTFPTLSTNFCWMNNADGYIITGMLCAAGVYYTDRRKYGFIAGALLLLAGMMAYQTCVCFAIALMALRYLQLLLEKKHTNGEMLRCFGRYGVALIGSIVLYVVLARFVLPALTGIGLTTHLGVETMGSIALKDLPGMIANAYFAFAKFLLYDISVATWRFVLYWNVAVGLLAAALILTILLRTKMKSALQTVLAFLMLPLLPLLFNTAYVTGLTNVKWLNIYSIVGYYLLLFVALRAAEVSHEQKQTPRFLGAKKLASYAAVVLLTVIACVHGIYDNDTYFASQLKYENSFALANRVLYSIEENPEYTRETPVYVYGRFGAGNYPPAKEAVFSPLSRNSGLQGDGEFQLIDNVLFIPFARYYLGVLLATPEDAARTAALASQEFLDMPCYPKEGSVRMINGILIVKASEPTES